MKDKLNRLETLAELIHESRQYLAEDVELQTQTGHLFEADLNAEHRQAAQHLEESTAGLENYVTVQLTALTRSEPKEKSTRPAYHQPHRVATRAAGSRQVEAARLQEQGRVAAEQGRYQDAVSLYQQSISIYQGMIGRSRNRTTTGAARRSPGPAANQE